MQKIREIVKYSDKQLDKEIELAQKASDKSLKDFNTALKSTLVGYVVILVVLFMNALVWQSVIVSGLAILFFVAAFIVVEHFDRKSDRALRHFGFLVEEKRVRMAYELGYLEGKAAKKKPAKKA